jgi:hypothetical protein
VAVLAASHVLALVSVIGQRGDPHPLGLVNIILIFAGGPLAVFLVLAFLCLRPQRSTGASRYRPGRGWTYGGEWFGTTDPLAADVETVSPGHGGASGTW